MDPEFLVIGASGSLGSRLMLDLSQNSKVVGTSFQQKVPGLIPLDIRNKQSVYELFKKFNPVVTIITAAMTNVEECEINPKDAFDVNAEGVENVIINYSGKVVFYSTDNVFEGKKDGYLETDLPSPINIYGKSKLKAESFVLSRPNNLVCRSSRFYSEGESKKYLNKVILSLREGELVKAPDNTEGNFTYIPDISSATIKLLEKNCSGIYHVAGSEFCSLYDAALKVAEIFGFDSSLVEKVDKDYFNNNVKRPSSPLKIDKIQNLGIRMRSLEEGLNEVRKFQNG